MACFARAVGEDQFAARKGCNRCSERWVRHQCRTVDLVDVGEEFHGADPMIHNQPAQRRSVILIIIFLQRTRGNAIESEEGDHKLGDAVVDLRPEIGIGGIKRIVEIENPGLDMCKGTAAWR